MTQTISQQASALTPTPAPSIQARCQAGWTCAAAAASASLVTFASSLWSVRNAVASPNAGSSSVRGCPIGIY